MSKALSYEGGVLWLPLHSNHNKRGYVRKRISVLSWMNVIPWWPFLGAFPLQIHRDSDQGKAITEDECRIGATGWNGQATDLTVKARAARVTPCVAECAVFLVKSSTDLSDSFLLSVTEPPFSTDSTSNLQHTMHIRGSFYVSEVKWLEIRSANSISQVYNEIEMEENLLIELTVHHSVHRTDSPPAHPNPDSLHSETLEPI